MTLIALTSAKHSPGVTTAALACATAWSAYHESLLVEADPAGGDADTEEGGQEGHAARPVAPRWFEAS